MLRNYHSKVVVVYRYSSFIPCICWCIDVLRVGPCFTKIEGNQCSGALTGIKCTQSLCCATLGLGWGVPCDRCPDEPHPCRRGFIYVAKEDNCQGMWYMLVNE